MQETRQMLKKERGVRIAWVLLGITLLILLTGIWAFLWVPPSPLF